MSKPDWIGQWFKRSPDKGTPFRCERLGSDLLVEDLRESKTFGCRLFVFHNCSSTLPMFKKSKDGKYRCRQCGVRLDPPYENIEMMYKMRDWK